MVTSTRSSTPWPSVLGFLVGLAGIAGSITVVFLGMRSVLDVGGQCASGGPYVIATPCPDGTWLLPLAIFAGLGFTFLAIATGTTIGGIYSSLPGLAWVGLFCSLGFNFLQWGIAPPADPSAEGSGGPLWVFLALGLMFEVMGLVPLGAALLGLRSGRGSAGRAGPPDEPGVGLDPGLWSAVAATVEEAGGRASPTGPRPGTGSDLVAALERLTALHQAGNLTDEEFAAAKHNLIEADS